MRTFVIFRHTGAATPPPLCGKEAIALVQSRDGDDALDAVRGHAGARVEGGQFLSAEMWPEWLSLPFNYFDREARPTCIQHLRTAEPGWISGDFKMADGNTVCWACVQKIEESIKIRLTADTPLPDWMD